MTNLFQMGDFTLNSGAKSAWKLECDSLTDADIQALAVMIRQLIGPFSSVEGVPRGGLRLAEALLPYQTEVSHWPHLIVDDVLTTGGSMSRAAAGYMNRRYGEDRLYHPLGKVVGAVVFARGPCPPWVKAVFQMPECFWIKPAVTSAPSAESV